MKSKQLERLRTTAKLIIKSLKTHENKRDELLSDGLGIKSPNWEEYKMQGLKSLKYMDQLDIILKQIYGLQGKTFEENAQSPTVSNT